MLKKIMTLALVASGLSLAACNTVEGAGEDVESVGEAVQDTAK
jgi:predicted small secreted protein